MSDRILLVEDRASFARSVQEWLTVDGWDVTWAKTYDEAEALGKHFNAFLVDFDLNDPRGRTGADFLATVEGRKVLWSGEAVRIENLDYPVFRKAHALEAMEEIHTWRSA